MYFYDFVAPLDACDNIWARFLKKNLYTTTLALSVDIIQSDFMICIDGNSCEFITTWSKS